MSKFIYAAGFVTSVMLASAASAQVGEPGSWAGPYIGIHGGYGIDDDATARIEGNTPNNLLALDAGIRARTQKQRREGWLGGGQLGFNLQSGNLVYGVEGDFSYMDQTGTNTYRSPQQVLTFPRGRRQALTSQLDWMATARARLGYSPSEKGMAYVTGGYAAGKVKGNIEFNGDTDAIQNYFGRHNYTASGWTAGGGAEIRPFGGEGALSRVSFRVETLYYDLGKSRIAAGQTNTPPGFYIVEKRTAGWNTRAGLNFAF